MALKTNYKADVFEGNRKYQIRACLKIIYP